MSHRPTQGPMGVSVVASAVATSAASAVTVTSHPCSFQNDEALASSSRPTILTEFQHERGVQGQGQEVAVGPGVQVSVP